MEQRILNHYIVVLVALLALALFISTAKGNDWYLDRLYTRDFGTHQTEAVELIEGYETLSNMHTDLKNNLSYAVKVENIEAVKILSSLYIETTIALERTYNEIVVFVKNHTGI